MLKRVALLLVLCAMALPLLAQGDEIPREAAIAAALARLGTRPLGYSYEIGVQTTSSTLGCPLAPVGDLGRPVLPYRYTLTYVSGDYVVYASSDGAVTVLCDAKFNAAVPTPTATSVGGVPAATVTPGGATLTPLPGIAGCQITSTGAFANVRATPNVSAAQVAQIFSGQSYAVAARSSGAELWYFIGAGWVNSNVTSINGADCNAVPVNDALVGTGAGLSLPSTDINVAQALQTYACPPTFGTTYLAPRIRVGAATAKVESGGIPNVLRSQPVANDQIAARIGTIQPNRTLDRVVNGPACSDGYVWWLVEVDGTQGWTVESDFSANDYFLEPTAGNAASANPTPVGTLPLVTDFAPVQLIRRDDTSGAQFVTISADNALALASDVIPGIPADTFIVAEYALALANPSFTDKGVASASAITDLFTLDDGTLVVAALGGLTYFVKQNDTYTQRLVVEDASLASRTTPAVGVSSDGLVYAFVGCVSQPAVNTPCTQPTLVLRAVTSPNPLWIAELPADFAVVTVAFSPDGQTVAALGASGVYLFDRITGIQQGLLSNPVPEFGLLDMAFNPVVAGQLLTSMCKTANTAVPPVCTLGQVMLWDVATSQALGIVETNAANPLRVMYSTDGSLILVSDTSGAITLRRGDNGTLLTTLVMPPAENLAGVVDMAISADGNQVVASDGDGNLFWWDITTLAR